jgi:hypothetical protein
MRNGQTKHSLGPHPKRPPSNGNNQKRTRHSELVELVLTPLANQVDRTRLEILRRIQEINDSVEIIARQTRRGMDE